MRYLLDSHILFWSVFEPHKLPARYKDVLDSTEASYFVSIVSLWELAIKQSLGKLSMPDDFQEILDNSSLLLLPVTLSHIKKLKLLPFHHRDPFDRMLVAQAQVEGLKLLTDDKQLSAYDAVLL